MSLILRFLYSQLFVTPPHPKKDFSGQTVVVTGANVGLGLEAARHFTRLNAEKVVLAVRSVEKGEDAKKSIEESTGRRGVVEVWQLDLSSYDSVKDFVRKAENLKRLDAVVENAGIATRQYRLAEDNESTITVNVVSTFLLALMILPKLRETATKYNTTPHLTIVSSEVHFFTQFPEKSSADIFKTLNDKEAADMVDRYQVSKLLEVLYCRELASRMKESRRPNVVLNFLNPGLCHSSLAREGLLFVEIMKFLLARSTEVGSRTLVHAATAGEESHGQYLSDCGVADPAPLVLSKEGAVAQKKVWDQLSQKLEAIQPGIMENV